MEVAVQGGAVVGGRRRERESNVFGESHQMVASGLVGGGWWPASLLL